MKLVIFDCDGTLVDSQAMITASLTKAFESQKLAPPSHASMLSIVGLSLINAMRKLAPDESETQQEALADAYKAAFWAFRDAKTHEEPLFPGAKAVLDALHAHERIKLGIATGKTRRGVDILLQNHGLEGRFVTIQTADSAPSKPDPAMILQAMQEAGIGPEDTVMIGDATYDLDMASHAGVAGIGVAWGFHTVELLETCRPVSILREFNELHAVLESVWADYRA
jgi:phosphoglycolate phosphatase